MPCYRQSMVLIISQDNLIYLQFIYRGKLGITLSWLLPPHRDVSISHYKLFSGVLVYVWGLSCFFFLFFVVDKSPKSFTCKIYLVTRHNYNDVCHHLLSNFVVLLSRHSTWKYISHNALKERRKTRHEVFDMVRLQWKSRPWILQRQTKN